MIEWALRWLLKNYSNCYVLLGIVFCTHLLFTFLNKAILHLSLANLNSIFRMKNEWVNRKKRSFFTKKILRKFLDPKTHFWKLTFLGKVILHMPVKFEQAQMRNEWVVRKKRSFFHKKHFTFLGKVILHMPVKFEQARLKNEGGVRKNVKWTHEKRETTHDVRQTLGVTDAITTAVSIPQC